MNLVYNVYFIFAARREAHVIAEFTNLIHAVVACPVNFEHIEADPLCYFSAGIADSTWIHGRALDAVHGLGEDTCSRRFARAARADEKVSMSQSLLLNCILQRANNVILA